VVLASARGVLSTKKGESVWGNERGEECKPLQGAGEFAVSGGGIGYERKKFSWGGKEEILTKQGDTLLSEKKGGGGGGAGRGL